MRQILRSSMATEKGDAASGTESADCKNGSTDAQATSDGSCKIDGRRTAFGIDLGD